MVEGVGVFDFAGAFREITPDLETQRV
jgi:hypothetical protein